MTFPWVGATLTTSRFESSRHSGQIGDHVAVRPVFVPAARETGFVSTVQVEFTWHPGFALSQKRKSIASLHAAAEDAGISPLLEVSTKSPEALGRALSAFNLKVDSKAHGPIPLEAAFQGSKVFGGGGPFTDLYEAEAQTAKRDPRLRSCGAVVGFRFEGEDWPTEPKTAFYDWLYLNALARRPDLRSEILGFQGFTDIEFNPDRSLNCQAASCALFVALTRGDLLEAALRDQGSFLHLFGGNPGNGGVQTSLPI